MQGAWPAWWAALALCWAGMWPTSHASQRTCYCELRKGPLSFSELLLDVEDPVLKGFVVTCRRARLWCPAACYNSARVRLLNGGSGSVSPLAGAAGQTACEAGGQNITADTLPTVHVYATYRVSNCHDSGFHYFGRLCCWEYGIGGDALFKFNEGCKCGPAPPCDDGSPSSSEPETSSDTLGTSEETST